MYPPLGRIVRNAVEEPPAPTALVGTRVSCYPSHGETSGVVAPERSPLQLSRFECHCFSLMSGVGQSNSRPNFVSNARKAELEIS